MDSSGTITRRRRRRLVGALIAGCLAALPAVEVRAESASDLIGEMISAIEMGDDVWLAELAERAADPQIWLPSHIDDAIARRDLDDLTLMWLSIESTTDVTLGFALMTVQFESDVRSFHIAGDPMSTEFVEATDRQADIVLQILDHRAIPVPPTARAVMSMQPVDGTNPTRTQFATAMDELVAAGAAPMTASGPFLDGPGGFPPSSPRPQDTGLPVNTMPSVVASAGTDTPPAQPTASPIGADTSSAVPDAIDEVDTDPTDAGDSTTEVGDADAEVADAADDVDASDRVVGDDAATTSATLDGGVGVGGGDGEPTTTGTAPRDARTGSGLPVLNVLLVVAVLASLAFAVTAYLRSRRHDRLADFAYTDALTGLLNRRRFDRDLAAENTHGERPTALLMVDVDHFKQFNDDHGHALGDEVLRRVGAALAANVRRGDLPYRYGGEEFSVLLPDTAPDEAMQVAERLRASIAGLRVDLPATGLVSTSTGVTVSIGVSTGPAAHTDTLLRRADEALYAAKHAGRNRVSALG